MAGAGAGTGSATGVIGAGAIIGVAGAGAATEVAGARLGSPVCLASLSNIIKSSLSVSVAGSAGSDLDAIFLTCLILTLMLGRLAPLLFVSLGRTSSWRHLGLSSPHAKCFMASLYERAAKPQGT